jgi:hypothetical protein
LFTFKTRPNHPEKKMLRSLIMMSLTLIASPAAAAPVPDCQVRVIRPVTDDMGNRWAAGKLLSVSIMRRDASGTSYCAHAGSCIPQMVRGAQAVRLANCKPGTALGNSDYRLDADPATMSKADVRRMRLQSTAEARLAALGFSNAASGSWANDYASDAASAHGRLVARALAGSRQAIATMKAQLP